MIFGTDCVSTIFFVGNISCPPTIGFVAANIADAATIVMTHHCAIFFFMYVSFSSVFDLCCGLQYEVGSGLDEGLADFFLRAREVWTNRNSRL